jgi:hypothetical protein
MKDYSKSKIYKIVCNISGLVYVGSTCEPTLARRLAKHVGSYKYWKTGKGKYTTSFKIIEMNNYDIVLLEEVKCETKDQLYTRERYYIENLVCVNKTIPLHTMTEYREEHKDEIKIQRKKFREIYKEEIKDYREKHKEEIKDYREKHKESHKEYMKEYWKNSVICTCQCGKNYKKATKSHHDKTKYHQNFIKSQTEINDDNLPCSLDGLELERN